MIASRFIISSFACGTRNATTVLRTVCATLLMFFVMSSAHAAVTCSASATGPAFAVYNPLNLSPTLANGTITTTCSLQSGIWVNVAFTLSYSPGFSSNFSSRNMLSGSNALYYNLYADAAYTQVLGDGTGGSTTGGDSMFLIFFNPTQQRSATIYGRIPPGQDVPAGGYSDTIVVTITY